MGVHESLIVEVGKRIEQRRQHVSYFAGSQRTLRKNLRKILVGIFHDDIKNLLAIHLALSGIEDADQVWMRKLSGCAPSRELCGRIRAVLRKEFDRSFLAACDAEKHSLRLKDGGTV